MPIFSRRPTCPDLSDAGRYEARFLGYTLQLEDYKRDKGEILLDQTSFRNMSVFNVKLRKGNRYLDFCRRYVCGKDEREHTKFNHPAASVGAVFERLMTYTHVLRGGDAPFEPYWFKPELEEAYLQASTPPDGVDGIIRESFRTVVNMFTPKSDTVGSLPGAKKNDPNGIVNKVSERIRKKGFDFDPDGTPSVDYLGDKDLLLIWTKEWANFESAIIWDDRIFEDGLEGFEKYLQGKRHRFPRRIL